VREDIVLAVRGRSRRFEQVEHERCTACGEQIFSLETSKRFDMAVLGSRKRHAA
jgi:YgiT-type zinc finger domain-containing protein